MEILLCVIGLIIAIYCGCAEEIGKEEWMRDPYGEDVASHIGPESCVYIRKGREWREEDWPSGIGSSNPGSGHIAGQTCKMR